MGKNSPLNGKDLQTVYSLWDELAGFPAGKMDAGLTHLFEWMGRYLGADNVTWIAAVRILSGPTAKGDPFSGWRLRTRHPWKPDSKEYRKLIAVYYGAEHYAKAAAYRTHERKRAQALMHGGATGQKMLALAGKFRVYRLRDGWIDFEAFQKSDHYGPYYRNQLISDRMHAGFPVTADAESIFMIDRRRLGLKSRQRFTDREKALTEMALRGMREFHRRLFLDHGLHMGATPLTPLQQRIVRGLLTGKSEKEIALALGQKPTTLHKYIKLLYARFGVNGRAALMSLWLGRD